MLGVLRSIAKFIDLDILAADVQLASPPQSSNAPPGLRGLFDSAVEAIFIRLSPRRTWSPPIFPTRGTVDRTKLRRHFIINATTTGNTMFPNDYFEEILIPTLYDSFERPDSRRHAYLTCIVTYHMLDYLEAAGEKNVYATMKSFCGSQWEAIHVVATAAKHLRNDRNKNATIRFTSGSDIFRPPARAGAMECGHSRLGDLTGGLYFIWDDQEYEIFDSLLSVCRGYFEIFGQKYGLVEPPSLSDRYR
jgi:hypothetical protein